MSDSRGGVLKFKGRDSIRCMSLAESASQYLDRGGALMQRLRAAEYDTLTFLRRFLIATNRDATADYMARAAAYWRN